MKNFYIPVTWSVWDKVKVTAESIEDALQYVRNHIDEIPLPTEPEYIDGSFRIEDGCDGNADMKETLQYLRDLWNLGGGIDGEEILL